MVFRRLMPNHMPQLSWRLGAFSRGISGRISKNENRSFSTKSKDKSECPLPDPNVCKPPEATSPGRAAGQKEAFFCDPDCRLGKPNLPPRGCLPWEKGIKSCPDKETVRTIQSPTCQHTCEPYVGQGFIDKLKVSECEYRRFEKCYEKEKDPRKCISSGSILKWSCKEYPLMHAVNKKFLPGSPITSHAFDKPIKEPEC